MAGLGSLTVDLNADTVKFQADMGRAAQIAERSMLQVQRAAQAAGSVLTGLLGVAGVASFAGVIKSAINASDELNKLSQKIGISVESLSELKFAAELADVNVDSLGKGVKFFNQALVEAADPTSQMARVFKTLGVDIRSGPDAAFRQFAQSVSLLEDSELKTTLATKVLGRAGQDLIPLLNAGSRGLDQAAESARNLGLVISGQTAQAAEAFNDNLKKLASGSSALGISIANEALPGLVEMTNQLTKAKEEGFFFIGILKEMAKIALATASRLPGSLGEVAGFAADAAFQSGSGALGGPKTGRIKRPGSAISDDEIFADFLGPDPNKLRNVLSGVKSLKDTAAREEAERLRKLGQNIIQSQQAIEDSRREAAEAESARGFELIREAEEERLRIEEGIFRDIEAQEEEYYLRGQQNLEIRKAQMKEAAEAARQASEASQQLGLTLTSALGELITGGGKAGDVMKALLKDIVQLVAKMLILEPIAKNIKAIFSGNGEKDGKSGIVNAVGSLISKFIPSFDVGTNYVPQDMLAYVHKGEAIIPAGQNAGGTYYIDARGSDREGYARLERMVHALNGSIEPRALNAVAGAKMRGGGFSSVFGG